MTAKELLDERFEIIADYPGCTYSVGRILTKLKGSSIYYDCSEAKSNKYVKMPDKYPHLFKKLNWWEKRNIEEMPKKLVSLINKDSPDFDIQKEEVYEIVEWDMDHNLGIIDKKAMSVCSLTSFKPEYGYIPVD